MELHNCTESKLRAFTDQQVGIYLFNSIVQLRQTVYIFLNTKAARQTNKYNDLNMGLFSHIDPD